MSNSSSTTGKIFKKSNSVRLRNKSSLPSPYWQGCHVGGPYNRFFSRRIYMKIEFSSLRREMLLFFITNMAAVTSRANQQFPVCTLLLIANENSIFLRRDVSERIERCNTTIQSLVGNRLFWLVCVIYYSERD